MNPSKISPRALADQFYYGNPFWSDPTDPESDEILLQYIIEVKALNRKVSRRFRRLYTFWGGLWAVWVVWVISDAEGAAWLFLFNVIGTIVAMLFAGLLTLGEAASTYQVVQDASRERYNRWLSVVMESDRAYYAQIMIWHETNTQVQLQRRQIDLQSQVIAEQQKSRDELQSMKQQIKRNGER